MRGAPEVATAHLLHGFIGAGKTTFARRLEHDHKAVRFTPDEWMARLFGEDPPAAIFAEKAAAITELLEPIWTRCLSCGVDVVLDYGFWRRRERDRARSLAKAAGGAVVLYDVVCADEEARRRVEARNTGEERSLVIAPATYDLLRSRIEPLGADEPAVRVRPGEPVRR